MEEITTERTMLITGDEVLDGDLGLSDKAMALLTLNLLENSTVSYTEKDVLRGLEQIRKDYMLGQMIFLAMNGVFKLKLNGKYPQFYLARSEEITVFTEQANKFLQEKGLLDKA